MLQHHDYEDAPLMNPAEPLSLPGSGSPAADPAELEAAVDYILDDCFFSVGQAVGTTKAIEHTALMWWRDRYRAKFLRTMTLFGNTWLDDRHRVIAVCRLLGEQAVKHAGDGPAIDLESAAKASKDVEQFCTRHARRRSRRLGLSADRPEMFAGYWCAA